MGQADSLFKGATFLCLLTSFQRVWIYCCVLICITRLSLFIAEKLLKTRKLFLVVIYYLFFIQIFFAAGQLFDKRISYLLEILVQFLTCFLRYIWLVWCFWSLCVPITRNVYKAPGVPDFPWVSTRSQTVICASTCCEGSADEGQLSAASGSRRCLNCTEVATAGCPKEQAGRKITFYGKEGNPK